MGTTRVTKKSRAVAEFAEIIMDMVCDGERDISKVSIVEAYCHQNLGSAASQTAIDIVSNEASNLLDNYFKEICAEAGELTAHRYHYTSTKWYKRGTSLPRTEEEAKQYVVCFGNGNRGRSAGVRFVTAEDDPDPMFLLAINKNMETVTSALRTHAKRLMKDVSSPAVESTRGNLVKKLPELSEID